MYRKGKSQRSEHVWYSVQFSSVTQSCLTLCNPMNRSTPGLPVHHQLPEFTQTRVHQVSDAIQPSHPLSSPSPPAPNPSHHQGLFQWVSSSHEVAKVLEFQLQHQSFQWTPGLISFRMDWLDLLSSWGSQGKNTEVVCHSLLQWTTFWQTSPRQPVRLGWPHTAWLSFIELDKAVVCVIRRFREGFLRSGLISGWKVVELDRERERNYV